MSPYERPGAFSGYDMPAYGATSYASYAPAYSSAYAAPATPAARPGTFFTEEFWTLLFKQHKE
jgi:hypothetical protein